MAGNLCSSETAARICLEVLRVNEWWSEPGKMAREELLHIARSYDQAMTVRTTSILEEEGDGE